MHRNLENRFSGAYFYFWSTSIFRYLFIFNHTPDFTHQVLNQQNKTSGDLCNCKRSAFFSGRISESKRSKKFVVIELNWLSKSITSKTTGMVPFIKIPIEHFLIVQKIFCWKTNDVFVSLDFHRSSDARRNFKHAYSRYPNTRYSETTTWKSLIKMPINKIGPWSNLDSKTIWYFFAWLSIFDGWNARKSASASKIFYIIQPISLQNSVSSNIHGTTRFFCALLDYFILKDFWCCLHWSPDSPEWQNWA